jgi:Uncharacterized conserved protein (DUF2075)
MARQNDLDLTGTQRAAWLEQADILSRVLPGRAGAIYLEFTIPRMGRRIDAVVIIGPVVFVFEFKVGERTVHAHDVDQVVDYALDLRHFHERSHRVHIAPVLICTELDRDQTWTPSTCPPDGLFDVARTTADGLAATIDSILSLVQAPDIDLTIWEASRYKPTPTIIEATLALYRGHSVTEISRTDAGATNLGTTAGTVASIIALTKGNSEKAICFVTGVPGAGKTLVGLDAATKHIDPADDLYSVFLSGNGPLVAVLQEALARDKVRCERLRGHSIRKGKALSEVKAFIQNVHHFRDERLIDVARPPVEHVAIFGVSDLLPRPAQRLGRGRLPRWWWTGNQSGEAGIGEWLEALDRSFSHWRVYVSDRLVDSEYDAGRVVETRRGRAHVQFRSELRLATSMRSFRSEKVSRLVKELLDLEISSARERLATVQLQYPIVLTRELHAARRWLRARARGSERYGIVVSSQVERLKPHAIDVRTPVNPVQWFLNDKDDVRSSYYLEDVATGFQVQGLELDWVCVTWDADFRFSSRGWEHRSFRGNRWERIRSPERQRYLKNAYRVLLTRARQGMVVVVPRGDEEDPTRRPGFYDSTFEYLASCGLLPI